VQLRRRFAIFGEISFRMVVNAKNGFYIATRLAICQQKPVLKSFTLHYSLAVKRDPLGDCDEPEQAINFKMAPEQEETPAETLKPPANVPPTDQRTLGEQGPKNLSIIVETSREYKSSSSGSGASACSKLQPFTPGESRFDTQNKR